MFEETSRARRNPEGARKTRGREENPRARGNPKGTRKTRGREEIPRIPRSASISQRLPSRHLAAQCGNLARDALAPSRRAPAAPYASCAGALPRLDARVSRGASARCAGALPWLDARISRVLESGAREFICGALCK